MKHNGWMVKITWLRLTNQNDLFQHSIVILFFYDDLIQVKWAKDNLDGYLNFYSVSGDGRVTNWTIVKTALWFNDILNIQFNKQLANFAVENSKTLLRDGGRCVAFNPNDETMFLVGTDEGLIYKCTTEYSSRY